jgi:multiple sugar transport system ATP-binding protein
MNLLRGEGRGGQFVMSDGLAFPIAPPRNGPLYLGVRPEDVVVGTGDQPGALSADIFAFELLGDVTLITLKLAGQHFVVKGDKSIRYTDGDRIIVRPEPSKMFWFDGTTGERIKTG